MPQAEVSTAAKHTFPPPTPEPKVDEVKGWQTKLSPAVVTLLVFMLMQGLGSIAVVALAVWLSPDFNEAIGDLTGRGLPNLEAIPASTFALMLMASNILAVLVCRYLLHYIRFVTASDVASIRWQHALLALAAGMTAAFGTSILTDDLELPDAMQRMTMAMANDTLGLVALVIVGPITEELLIREAIAGEMLRRKANPWLAIIVSAIAFSIAHLNLAQGLYALPLGIIFGIIYCKTGNILLTSILHIINNASAAFQIRFFGEELDSTTFTEILGGPCQAIAVAATLGLISATLTYFLWNSPSAETIPKNK